MALMMGVIWFFPHDSLVNTKYMQTPMYCSQRSLYVYCLIVHHIFISLNYVDLFRDKGIEEKIDPGQTSTICICILKLVINYILFKDKSLVMLMSQYFLIRNFDTTWAQPCVRPMVMWVWQFAGPNILGLNHELSPTLSESGELREPISLGSTMC